VDEARRCGGSPAAAVRECTVRQVQARKNQGVGGSDFETIRAGILEKAGIAERFFQPRSETPKRKPKLIWEKAYNLCPDNPYEAMTPTQRVAWLVIHYERGVRLCCTDVRDLLAKYLEQNLHEFVPSKMS
jgi:hypothetical protein